MDLYAYNTVVFADPLTHSKAAEFHSSCNCESNVKIHSLLLRLVLGHCSKSTSGQDLHQYSSHYAVHRQMSNATFGTSSDTRNPMDM